MIESGGAVRGLNAGRREMPRSELDGLIFRAQELGAKGLVWAFREGEGWLALADRKVPQLRDKVNPDTYGGSYLIGLRAIAVKAPATRARSRSRTRSGTPRAACARA